MIKHQDNLCLLGGPPNTWNSNICILKDKIEYFLPMEEELNQYSKMAYYVTEKLMGLFWKKSTLRHT